MPLPLSTGMFSLVLLLPAVADAGPRDLSQLAWLGGCWQAEDAEAGSGEHWMPLAGGTLLGVSRTVKQGRTVAHEFMQIREDANGQVAFFAQPAGQPPAVFPLLRISATEAVFQDLEHDFPQRVVYGLAGPDRLDARIEGVRDGAPVAVRFPMRRVSCDAQLPVSK